MRVPPLSFPTDVQIVAIARLLIARARAGDFGLDDAMRPPGIWPGNAIWEVRFPMRSYFLNHVQAAAVALGKVTIVQAGEIWARGGYLFFKGQRDSFARHAYPTEQDVFPLVETTLRKTPKPELSYGVQVTKGKAARGGL